MLPDCGEAVPSPKVLPLNTSSTAAVPALHIALILNELLVPSVRPELVAFKVYAVPPKLMLNPENVAAPLVALTVVVPERTPLPGFESISTVMDAFELVTVLPLLS